MISKLLIKISAVCVFLPSSVAAALAARPAALAPMDCALAMHGHMATLVSIWQRDPEKLVSRLQASLGVREEHLPVAAARDMVLTHLAEPDGVLHSRLAVSAQKKNSSDARVLEILARLAEKIRDLRASSGPKLQADVMAAARALSKGEAAYEGLFDGSRIVPASWRRLLPQPPDEGHFKTEQFHEKGFALFPVPSANNEDAIEELYRAAVQTERIPHTARWPDNFQWSRRIAGEIAAALRQYGIDDGLTYDQDDFQLNDPQHVHDLRFADHWRHRGPITLHIDGPRADTRVLVPLIGASTLYAADGRFYAVPRGFGLAMTGEGREDRVPGASPTLHTPPFGYVGRRMLHVTTIRSH